jgi:hypothetical protein
VTRLRFAVPAIASLVVLSACAGTFTPPAAIVDGVAITQDALKERVDLASADPNTAAQLAQGGPEAEADFTRQVLGSLIVQQVIEGYADGHGLTVTTAEINRELNDEIQRTGRAAFERELRQRGLTVADVRQSIRSFLLQNKVRDDITKGLPPSTSPEQVNQFLNQWLERQVARADIEVNPRFGRFEPKQVAVCRVVSTAGDVSPSCGRA